MQARVAPAIILVWLSASPALAAPAAGPACPADGAHRLARPATGPFTAGYGVRQHPLLDSVRLHIGHDYQGLVGDPVTAAAGGEVIAAEVRLQYGKTVVIRHGDGRETLYAHLSALAVEAGACVSSGQVIGRIGATGLATGPHLHFEVIEAGRPIDPMPLMAVREAVGLPDR
ncbi:MAG: M23 family metallopeptidase [Hyphomicrobiaceae bacterium]|nr:M23 family metallopeptidase [Hyphomicrobiaceae bacterium]